MVFGPQAEAEESVGKRAKLKSNAVVRDGLLKRMRVAMDELAPKEKPPQQGKGSQTKFLVSEPWDKLRGRTVNGKSEFDLEVPANLERLRGQAAMALAQHWAPDCSTLSRVLDRPIAGAPAGKGPQPLRSRLHPRGLPWKTLQAQFGTATAKAIHEKLTLHNLMAVTAAQECIRTVREGRFACIENPGNSYLWQLPEYKELAAMSGMVWFTLHNCAFGGKRRKYTGILTNIPGLQDTLEKRCGATGSDAVCDFSGAVHESWEATWKKGFGHTVTNPEAEYPRAMCETMAAPIVACEAAAPELAARMPYAFIEVFSGPNAPLTQAVRRAMALKRQGAGGQQTPADSSKTPPRA